ncbi:hypothetical protein VTO58DRAFT_103870 [Aureobasidium pullulans]|nr:hypothetical protein JADG_009684 [Aureobasidium pullulans]KAG2169946.1 hypothetical protein JADG_009685 [Aureobasidium pullulans]
MAGQDRARQQRALDIDFTVDGADMDTMRKKILQRIGSSMVQNDGDESMGLPRFQRLTSRDIQTIHDSTPYTRVDGAESPSHPSTTGFGNSSVPAAVQSQSIASRSVEPALGPKHRTNPWSHIRSPLSRQGQAYSYDQPSVAFDKEDSTPAEIAAQGHDRLLDSNIAVQDQTTHSSFQADTELMQQSHRPLPTSPRHVLTVEHRRDAGIQRPASPRLRPLLDRLDALEAPVDAVPDCALPVGQPFSPSTRSARRSERSIMNTHYSPVCSMGPGIPTMTSLNLSIPVYLRGVEQPREGGNRNLRNLIFLPSPLRNEINFSTSDRDLPSSSSHEITSDNVEQLADTSIIVRDFAHLPSISSTRPTLSHRLLYRDGCLVDPSTDGEVLAQPSMQQRSAPLVANDYIPATEAVSDHDLPPVDVAGLNALVPEHTATSSQPHTGNVALTRDSEATILSHRSEQSANS